MTVDKKKPAPKKAAPPPKAGTKPESKKAAAPRATASKKKPPQANKPLAPKVQRFIDEYLIDMNGSAAYKRAGYTATGNSAEVCARRLLRNAQVSSEIARRRDATAQKLDISREEALTEAWAIVKADPRELIEYRRFACPACYEDGHEGDRRDPVPACLQCHGDGLADVIVKDTRKLSPQARALYAGVKMTKDGLEVKMHSKLDALEKVFRHLGMYDADKPPAANVSVSVQAAPTKRSDLAPADAYLIMVQGAKK